MEKIDSAIPRTPGGLPGFWLAVKKFGIVKALVLAYLCKCVTPVAGITWTFLRYKGWWFKKSLKGEIVYITGAGSKEGLGRNIAI